jgi:hypothetical protein
MSFEKYNISLLYKKWIKTTKRRLYEIEKHRRKKKLIYILMVVRSISVTEK